LHENNLKKVKKTLDMAIAIWYISYVGFERKVIKTERIQYD